MTDAKRMRDAGAAAEAAGPGRAGSTVASCPLAAHWIEIELLGEDGVGIADADYEIKLPDGAQRRGKLDARGYARADGIRAGACEITFPTLDTDAWERKR